MWSNLNPAFAIFTWGTGTRDFSIRNDSLVLAAEDAGSGCFLAFGGTLAGGGLAGRAASFGTCAPNATFTWTATKQ